MARVLVASDLPSLRAFVRSALEGPDVEILEAASGRAAVRIAVDEEIDLLICDLQIGAMGGVAIATELHNQESAGDADHVAVLMLLDRRPDVFLARRSSVEGFCVKPLEPQRLRRAVRAVLGGGTFEDDAWRPMTVRTPVAAADG